MCHIPQIDRQSSMPSPDSGCGPLHFHGPGGPACADPPALAQLPRVPGAPRTLPAPQARAFVRRPGAQKPSYKGLSKHRWGQA
ncbi:hypothetical protein CENSYa_0529 [Cenarchaeum symbiosum A]|uniref:Uncharacterized protein n=1 Tax=Cenarchaeum symbiosum (strain A) TaxID=414004 RepID=A0RUZ5_CENSY|nr:hypothetical protein CENSYa_0529 [Cenarchaeum symbiosum A]